MYHEDDLHLRKVAEEDLPLLLALKSESWERTHRTAIANMVDQRRWLESLDPSIHQPGQLVLIAEIDRPIGTFKISDIEWVNRRANVGWDIFEKYRGRGFGKKLVVVGTHFCFNVLNLHRLDAEILENNVASIKCATAAEFVLEGTKREAVFKNGVYLNSLVFGCLNNPTGGNVDQDKIIQEGVEVASP